MRSFVSRVVVVLLAVLSVFGVAGSATAAPDGTMRWGVHITLASRWLERYKGAGARLLQERVREVQVVPRRLPHVRAHADEPPPSAVQSGSVVSALQ